MISEIIKLKAPLFKTLEILKNVAENNIVQGLKVSEIAEIADLKTITMHHHLTKLQNLGFIKKSFEYVSYGSSKVKPSKLIIEILNIKGKND